MRSLVVVLIVLGLASQTAAAIFSDVAGHPAQRAIERLAAKGVVAGVGERFLPGEPLTRLDVVRFLVRLLGIPGESARLPAFKDLDQIPPDARPAVAASVGVGTVSATKVEVKKGAIVYTLTTDKAAYGPEEPVLLTFIVHNTGKTDVTFEYANSQFHDFIVKAADGSEVARWSLGRAFLPVDKPVPLAAGKSLSFQTRWRQLDQNDRPVPVGRYEIVAVHTTKQEPTQLSLSFQKGLVVGYPDNTFRPRQPVTRAELAALTVRAGGLDAEAFARARAQVAAADGAAVPDWARGSVAVVLERKMLPLLDGAFRPGQPATRADAAVALDALMGLLNKYDWTKGTLRAVQPGRPATLAVEDDQKAVRTFRVAPAHAVYRNDRPATLAELRPGDAVQFLKPADVGDVVYIEATGR
jgi:hypothetical protein